MDYTFFPNKLKIQSLVVLVLAGWCALACAQSSPTDIVLPQLPLAASIQEQMLAPCKAAGIPLQTIVRKQVTSNGAILVLRRDDGQVRQVEVSGALSAQFIGDVGAKVCDMPAQAAPQPVQQVSPGAPVQQTVPAGLQPAPTDQIPPTPGTGLQGQLPTPRATVNGTAIPSVGVNGAPRR